MMRMPHMFAGFAVTSIVLAVPMHAAAQEVDLRPKYQPGASSTLIMNIRSVSKVKPTGGLVPGGAPGGKGEAETSDQESDQTITFTEKVVDWNAETGGTVQMIYDRVTLKIKSDALGEHNYDSGPAKTAAPASKDPFGPGIPVGPSKADKPAPAQQPQRKKDALDNMIEDAMKPDLSGVPGTVLTLKVDAAGNILSVTGGEKLPQGGMFGPALTLPNTPDGFKGLFGPIKPDVPSSTGPGGKPGGPQPRQGYVRVGEKWTTTSNVTIAPMGPVTIKTDHELKSVRGAEAEISYTGKLESQSQGGAPGTPGMPLVKISGSTYRGSYTWDTRLGQLRKMVTEQRTEAESPMGTMQSESTIRVERKGVSTTNKPM